MPANLHRHAALRNWAIVIGRVNHPSCQPEHPTLHTLEYLQVNMEIVHVSHCSIMPGIGLPMSFDATCAR